jgi:hypothetical protein
MTKLGLLLEFVGFCMLFWLSYARSKRNVEEGGGVATDQATEQSQIERVFNWLPNGLKRWVPREREVFALGMISAGVFCQVISA